MKSIIVALSFVGVFAFYQQRTFSRSDQIHLKTILLQDQKVEITKDELPDVTQETLESDEYYELSVLHCYKIMDGDALVEYEVDLDNSGTPVVLKFDPDGYLKTTPGT